MLEKRARHFMRTAKLWRQSVELWPHSCPNSKLWRQSAELWPHSSKKMKLWRQSVELWPHSCPNSKLWRQSEELWQALFYLFFCSCFPSFTILRTSCIISSNALSTLPIKSFSSFSFFLFNLAHLRPNCLFILCKRFAF
jgi:hypothetical protein